MWSMFVLTFYFILFLVFVYGPLLNIQTFLCVCFNFLYLQNGVNYNIGHLLVLNKYMDYCLSVSARLSISVQFVKHRPHERSSFQCFSVLHAPVIWDSSVTPPSLLLQQWVLGSCQQSASFTMRCFPPTEISKCYTVRFQIEDAVQNFMWDWKSMHDYHYQYMNPWQIRPSCPGKLKWFLKRLRLYAQRLVSLMTFGSP